MKRQLQLTHARALKRLEALGLKSYSRLAILLLADPDDPVTAAEIVEALDFPYQSGTSTLNDLRRKGFIEPVRINRPPRTGTRGAPTTVAWRRSGEVDEIIQWAYEEVEE